MKQLALAVLIRFYHVWRLWKVIAKSPIVSTLVFFVRGSDELLQLWMFKIYLGRDSAFAGEDVRRLLHKVNLLMLGQSIEQQVPWPAWFLTSSLTEAVHHLAHLPDDQNLFAPPGFALSFEGKS